MRNSTKCHSILIVDDENSVLKALQRLLRDEDYEVFAASNRKDTMDLLARHNFAVVMTDFKMPDVCGSDLLGLVRATYPATIRVMLSGSADSRSVPAAIANPTLNCQVFMSKPWNDDELRTTIRKCVAEYEAAVKSHSSV